MPTFAYTAIARDGRTISAQVFAESRSSLAASLKRRQLLLQDCREIRAPAISASLTLALVSQLSGLVGNGVVVERALQIIAEDSNNPKLSALADLLRQGVKRGQPLSQALLEIGRCDPLLVPLLRAGEASGEMPRILAMLESHYEKRQKTKRAMIGGLAYPAILVLTNLLSIIGLGVYVIPVFKTIFEDRMQTLASSTRLIFWISDVLVAHGVLMVAVLGGFAVSSLLLMQRSDLARFEWDRLQLRLPLIGPFIGKTQATNVMAVLGLLLTVGVPLVPAMELAIEAVSNRPVRQAMGEALKQIRRGQRTSTALRDIPGFPKLVNRLVTVGEETGRLGDMCQKAAASLAEEADVQLRAMVTALEPILILLMGGVVSFVVLSMLLAVYSISDIQ